MSKIIYGEISSSKIDTLSTLGRSEFEANGGGWASRYLTMDMVFQPSCGLILLGKTRVTNSKQRRVPIVELRFGLSDDSMNGWKALLSQVNSLQFSANTTATAISTITFTVP